MNEDRLEKEVLAWLVELGCVGIPVDRDRPFRFVVTGDSGGS